MNVKIAIGIFLAALAVVFIIQNASVMELRFLFWKLAMSGALLMILILSTGIVLGWLLHGIFSIRKKRGHDKQGAVKE